jgi:Na+/phosphate symporter
MDNQIKYKQILDMTENALKTLKAEDGDKQHILLLEELQGNTLEMMKLDRHHNRANDMRLRELNRANIPLFLEIAKFEGTTINEKNLKILER